MRRDRLNLVRICADFIYGAAVLVVILNRRAEDDRPKHKRAPAVSVYYHGQLVHARRDGVQ